MKRLGCYFVLALIVGTGYGFIRSFNEFSTAIGNREPTRLTVREFTATRPSAKWLELTDADVSLLRASYISKLGTIEEVYIPILPKDAADNENQPVIILQSTRPDLLKHVTAMSKLEGDGEVLKYIVNNPEILDMGDSVSGIIGQWGDIEDRTRSKLQKLNPALGKNFVVLLDGKKPSFMRAILMLCLGIGCLLILGALMLFSGGSTKSDTTAEAMEPAADTATPS